MQSVEPAGTRPPDRGRPCSARTRGAPHRPPLTTNAGLVFYGVFGARDIELGPSEVLIPHGSEQALSLVLRLLANHGETVALEQPTYSTAMSLLEAQGLQALGVSVRESRMDLDALDAALRRRPERRPALVYTIPTYQNPTGITTSQSHRERLLELCERHQVPLVEDGFQEEISYFGRAVLPVKSMDRNGCVFYLGSFSKVFGPAISAFWIGAPPGAWSMVWLCPMIRGSSTLGPLTGMLAVRGSMLLLAGLPLACHPNPSGASRQRSVPTDRAPAAATATSEGESDPPSPDEDGNDAMWEAAATAPVPPSAKVTLELDRDWFFVGENVLVHFVLTNAGDQPFKASFGGDYRGSGRSLRFKVRATDEHGHLVEDPNPSPSCFGGREAEAKLKPGESHVESLPLMRYRRIDHAGRYTVRVTHDFGWKEGERLRPVGETKITFRLPSPEEAEKVVQQMEKLPEDPRGSFGKKSVDYADFSCLSHPVYLEPLLRRAAQGKFEAFEGIAAMPTPEATRALLALAENPESKLTKDTVEALIDRLPLPPEAEQGVGRPQGNFYQVRRLLSRRAWDPKLTDRVRALAIRLLADAGTDAVGVGARLMESIGTTPDREVLVAALQRALDSTVNSRDDPKDDILSLPKPMPDLLRAIDRLDRDRPVSNKKDSGEAGLLLSFHRFAGKPGPRPEDWLNTASVFGEDGRYPVRVAALQSIPEEVPPKLFKLVRGRLEDPDLGVVRAACAVAGRTQDRSFIKPLLEIIATEHHKWVLSEATEAARKLGAGVDLLLVWADRLGDEHLFDLALDALEKVIDGLPGGSSGRTDLSRSERLALRKEWQEFLKRHLNELRQGKRFKIGDPAISTKLFGRARCWQLSNGSYWPAAPWDIDSAHFAKPSDD